MQDLDYFQAPRIQELQAKAEAAQAETEKRQFLILLVREIILAINQKTISTIEEGVEVNNFDEIQAALRNELSKANKPLSDLLKKLNLSTQEQTKITSEIQTKLLNKFSEYQTVVVKRVNDVVEVRNLDEIVFPGAISVSNLSELETYFKDLSEKIGALKLSVTVPEAQITVTPTPISIPETVIPEVRFDVLISSLEKLLKPLAKNNKAFPLAVRLSDGQEWIKELKAISEAQKQTVQYMSDVAILKNAAGMTINPATDESLLALATPRGIGDDSVTVTTAGTRVPLSATSVPCRWVIVVGNSDNDGLIWLGGSTVAAGRGRPLNPEQSERIEINDLSKVYVDAANNNDGVSFIYGV